MNRFRSLFCLALISLLVIFITGCGGSSSAPIVVSSPNAAIDQGQMATLTATSDKGVTWTITSGPGTLSGQTATTAIYTAPNTVSASTQVVVTATSMTGTGKSGTITITVNPPPAVTTASLAAATEFTAYSVTLTATGGAGTLTWSLGAGSAALPAGLTLNSTGTITGMATGPAGTTSNIILKVTDSGNPALSATSGPLSLIVSLPAAPTLAPVSGALPPATEGTAYSQTITVSNGHGPYIFSVINGTLPAGLTGSSSGAMFIISGTPSGPAGPSAFSVKVVDSSNPTQSATNNYVIVVGLPAAPAITTTQAQVTAAPATAGSAYSFTFHATGTGTLTWGAIGLPADGLSLNAGTGVVSGTPTTKQSVSFTLTVSDTFGQSSGVTAFTITVNNPAPPVISTTPAQVPSATVNVAYNFTFQGSGSAPLTWSWSLTPATSDGLSINSSTGAVTGTPTTATTLSFSVSLTDNFAQVTTVNGYSIVVSTESIAFTSSVPSSMAAGATQSVSATVSNDPGNGGVNWTVTCSGGPCGSFTANHTASGVATTYDAPAVPPSGGNVTITATAADAPSPVVSAVVTINAPPLVFNTSSLPSGTVNTAYNATITASGGVPPYIFSLDVTSTPLPANLTFNPGSPSATITGTPTSVGTTNNIVVDVKDSETVPMTKQITFSITVNAANVACGSGSESLLKGQYAILLRGFDSSGPVGIGATFDADAAGHIAKLVGLEDINSSGSSGVQNLSITSGSSSYSVGSDHRGCLTIVNSAGTTQKFRFSLGAISSGVASNGHIIEFDATGSNTAGVLALQDTSAFLTSQITGNYAFGVSGPDVGGGKFAAVGMVSFNGGGGFNNSPASVVDFNDKGDVDGNGTTYPTSPVSLSQGLYSISASGRGTFSFLPGGGGSSSTVHTILYVVSSSELFILSADLQSSNNLFVGSVLQQSAGSFTGSSLNGKSILYVTGLGSSSGSTDSRISAGIFTGSSGVNFTFSGQQNDGGNISAQAASGTYSVATDGRVTLAGGGGGGTPIFYLVSANKGFVLFTDGSTTNAHVASGFLDPQTGSSFSTSSAHGTYAFGVYQPEDSSVDDSIGVATFDGAGNITGTSDDNSSGTLNAGNSISDTYSIDATGLGVIPANCTIGTNCDNIFYVISPTKAVLLKTKASNTDPNLQVAEQ
jgi:hypothetical protein